MSSSTPALRPPFELKALTLESERVRLEPLGTEHTDALRELIERDALHQLFVTTVPAPDAVERFINTALEDYRAGNSLAFATIDKSNGALAGSTRFMKAEPVHQRLEIGFTFLGVGWQRTHINTEAKLLMLEHAFEQLGVNRVEFLTDFLNQASRRAIAKLGAREEGILRSHMVMRDGRIRDSVLFSITQQDWPGTQQLLQHRLATNKTFM